MNGLVLAASMNPIGLVFGWLEMGIGHVLAFLYDIVPVYGICIILLTLLLRGLLYPLFAKSTRSMRKMQLLQPEVKKLQERYKNDRQKLSEMQMALFRANKVSPLSGCLPLVLQAPIFMALFRVINGNIGKKVPPGSINTNFFQGTALAAAIAGSTLADPRPAAMFLGLNLGVSPSQAFAAFGKQYGILDLIPQILLVGAILATGWFQQKQLQARNANQQQNVPQAMQTATKFMPLLFGMFSLGMPAGVNLYFLTSNSFQMFQQWLIFRNQEENEIILPDELKSGKPSPAKPAVEGGRAALATKSEKARTGGKNVPEKKQPKKGGGASGGSGKGDAKSVPQKAERKRVSGQATPQKKAPGSKKKAG